MQHDDIRGVGEILNETVCLPEGCKGLTVVLISFLAVHVATYQLLREHVTELVSKVVRNWFFLTW